MDYKLLLLSSPASGREREFNDWYELHIPQLVRSSQALVGAQRFWRVNTAALAPPYQHLVVAEFRAEDLAASWDRHLRDFRAGVEAGALTPPPTDLFEPGSAVQWAFEPVGPHVGK